MGCHSPYETTLLAACFCRFKGSHQDGNGLFLQRPSVVAAVTGENLILCQITSQTRPDPDIIALQTRDFKKGLLKMDSYIRPAIIFTIHRSKIEYLVGKLTEEKVVEVEGKLCEIFTR